jgi:hypothetical protein
MHSNVVSMAKTIIAEHNANPDFNHTDGADIVGALEDALGASRLYDKTMNVTITALAVSTMRPVWGASKVDIAADGDECISPKALVEKYLDAVCEETLEAHMKRRGEWGYGTDFEDNFTIFEIANCTTVTFFDMDNEIIILVAKNSDHDEE